MEKQRKTQGARSKTEKETRKDADERQLREQQVMQFNKNTGTTDKLNPEAQEFSHRLTMENLISFEEERKNKNPEDLGKKEPETSQPTTVKMNAVTRNQISGLKSAVSRAITKISQAVSEDKSKFEIEKLEDDITRKKEKVVEALEIFGVEKNMEAKILEEIQAYEEKVELELTRVRELREASVIGSSSSSRTRRSYRTTPKAERMAEETEIQEEFLKMEQTTESMPKNEQSGVQPYQTVTSFPDRAAAHQGTPEPPQEQTFLPPQQTFLPQEQTFLPQEQTFIPQEHTFLPQEHTFLPPRQTFLPPQQAFLPQQQTFLPYQPIERNNLTRISVEKFYGKVSEYRGWRASFNIAVDRTNLRAEEKMLRLRNALGGKAKVLIEDLQNFTDAQYREALERLDREFGTDRREGARLLEKLQKLPAIKDNSKDKLEKLKELLNTLNTTISFMESTDRKSELGDGMMYLIVKCKIPETELFLYEQQQKSKDKTLYSLRDWLKEIVETKTRVREAVIGIEEVPNTKETKKPWDQKDRYEKREKNQSPMVNATVEKTEKCDVCQLQNHSTKDCRKFRRMNLKERWQKVKSMGLCRICLERGHLGTDCKLGTKTGDNPSHKLLRPSNEEDMKGNKKNETKKDGKPKSTTETEKRDSGTLAKEEKKKGEEKDQVTANVPVNPYISLRTVAVILKHENRTVKTIAMLDDGSSETYLHEDIAHELGLPVIENARKTSKVFGNKEESYNGLKVSGLHIRGATEEEEIELHPLWTHPVLIGSAPVVDWKRAAKDWPHLSGIPFAAHPRKDKVGILVGNRHPYLHMALEEVTAQDERSGAPIARRTPLGWTCIGPTGRDHHEEGSFTHMVFHTREEEMEITSLVKTLWELEAVGLGQPKRDKRVGILTPEEDRARSKVLSTLKYDRGRYQVGTPWKTEPPDLPENMSAVAARQERTERRLKIKDPELYKRCTDVIEDQVKKGYLRPLGPVQQAPSDGFQIPVFPVKNESRTTTKVRMVLDCAAKFGGVSLNDCILPGPKLHNELIDVLLRFRRYKVAIMGDISEMFLQIELAAEDRKFYRIIWGQEVYEYQRTIFGDCSSPFKANLVVKENAKKFEKDFPETVETIESSTYVDDTMDSKCTIGEGSKTLQELSEIMKRGSMSFRKCLSNYPEALEGIPESDRVQSIDIHQKDSLPSQKALGMLWLASEDIFGYQVESMGKVYPATRRGILKCIATLFDPFGFIDPYRIKAWIIFQRTWLRNGDWDSPLDEDLAEEWNHWREELDHLEKIRVERHIGMDRETSTSLHVFCDASKEAFTAVIYARTKTQDGKVITRLVISKTRLSPLKSISIAKLELCGAVTGTRLVERVIGTLEKGNVSEPLQVTYWTDSLNVLYWISQPGKQFKPYVSNRVGEIQEKTNTQQWKHVPTKQNPADLGTRGLSLRELETCSLWWQGPEFLQKAEEHWPKKKIVLPGDEALQEKSPTFVVKQETEDEKFMLHPKHWSDMGRLTKG